MLRLPDRHEKVDKELLKRVVCFVIENYYGSDDVLYANGRIINDNEPLDLTRQNISITRHKEYQEFNLLSEDKKELTRYLKNTDMSFKEALISYISLSGKTDAEIYRLANVSRASFNRIINAEDNDQRPVHISKRIAFALAAALHLTVYETETLLAKAGLSFSYANKQDLIIRYCFDHHVYDVITINEVLHFFDQELIGSI